MSPPVSAENLKTSVADHWRSFALFALALAIAYFAFALASIARHIPDFLAQVEELRQQAGATVEKVNPIVEAVPDILSVADNISTTIPAIVNESEQYRALVPQILQEIEANRAQIPIILQQVDLVQKQVDGLHKDLPEVLSTIGQASATIAETNKQVADIIPLVPPVLDQIEQTRVDIPVYLTRVENIVASSREVTEEAGKGAVTGVFKGIIATPFDLLKGGKDFLVSGFESKNDYTEKDLELVFEAAKSVLESERITSKSWSNPDSGHSGQISMIKQYQKKGLECKQINVMFRTKNGNEENSEESVCLNENGQWEQAK